MTEVNCSANGDTWGKRSLWLIPIVSLVTLGLIPIGIPSVLRWYFLFTGLFSYPIFMMGSPNKDDYTKGEFKGAGVEYLQIFFSLMFFVATLLLKVFHPKEDAFIWQSASIFCLLSYLPYWFKKTIQKENIFYRLDNLKDEETVKFISDNHSYIEQRPYLFFYEAVAQGRIRLAKEIYSKHKLTLSMLVHIKGIGMEQPETISNILISHFYKTGDHHWKEVMAFLEPLGLQIDSRSVEIVKEIETGIKWVDKLAKENDSEKLALRNFISIKSADL